MSRLVQLLRRLWHRTRLARCCADRGNRLPLVGQRLPPGWSVQLCGVCGRRHITLTAREAEFVPALAG